MTIFTLYNLLVMPFVFAAGWSARALFQQVWPYVVFWWNNRGPDYGALPKPKEKPVRELATEYNQVPLRKRLAKGKDKGLN